MRLTGIALIIAAVCVSVFGAGCSSSGSGCCDFCSCGGLGLLPVSLSDSGVSDAMDAAGEMGEQ